MNENMNDDKILTDSSSHNEDQGRWEDNQSLSDSDDTDGFSQALSISKSDFSRLPLCEIPSHIRARGEFSRGKTFLLSNSSTGEDLFCIEVHTGYSRSAPLGTRPGVILHNGLSKKDPVLAAAGDESPLGVVIPTLDRSSLIFAPPLEPGKNYSSFSEERMQGEQSLAHNVVYSFFFETGEKLGRQRYEWRKFQDSSSGGFRLVRIWSNQEANPSSTPTASSAPATSGQSSMVDGQIIAILKWRRFWAGFTLDGYFELEIFSDAANLSALARRLKVMIIITAARLWHQRIKGKT